MTKFYYQLPSSGQFFEILTYLENNSVRSSLVPTVEVVEEPVGVAWPQKNK